MQGTISYEEIAKFVEDNISIFHDKQLEELKKLSLVAVLSRKNPYLFKAKNLNTVGDLVKYVFDAFLISREETNFGDFLERLAIFINGKIYGGVKSNNTGMDLEFDKNNTHYIVSIKSGPKWANSDQLTNMVNNFDTLIKTLVASNPSMTVEAVNGCCYGRDTKPKKVKNIRGENKQLIYYKHCGQRFWTFISDNPDLYTDIIEPLGHQAKEKNEVFSIEYANLINKFTLEFITKFCDSSGAIKWDDIVKLSSSNDAPPKPPKVPTTPKTRKKKELKKPLAIEGQGLFGGMG